MNQDRLNAMQEAYDNQAEQEESQYQTQEEMDKEADQEFRYNRLIKDAADGDSEAKGYDAFCDAVTETLKGECNEFGDLLFQMIIEAADYNGSEAETPDFVRLVRMAFEWRSKQ